MVARIPVGLSTSALLHAGALALLVLIPVLGKAPLPEPSVGKTLLFAPAFVPPAPRVVAAPASPRRGGARPPGVVAVPVAAVVPAVPQVEASSIEEPTDSPAPCLLCPIGDAGPATAGEDPGGVGSTGVEGAAGGEVGPIRVSGVEAPRKLVHVAPRYPEIARRAGLQGTVELECMIDPAGAVAGIRVLKGATLLRDAAVEAVWNWRYTPTRLNGVPVPVIMTVTVHFSLRRES